MRASELLAAEVRARDGASLGPVRDVRIAVEADGALVVKGIVVGGGRFAGLAHAWGFAEGRAQGPWAFRRLTRQACREARFAPAERVLDWGPGVVRVDLAADELAPFEPRAAGR